MANDLRNRPEFNDIDNLVKNYFRDEFGSNIDLDDPTTAGMFAGVISKVCDKLAKTFEGGVNSLFVLRSHGSDLDDLGTEWQVYRRPATYAFANEEITAYVDDPSNPTVIPAGSSFSTSDGVVFHSLDGLIFNKQTDSLTDDDGLPLQKQTVQVISSVPGYAQNVQQDTITNADSVDGLYSCTNLTAAAGGNDSEPDGSLQKRIMSARSSSPAFSDNGIVDAINRVPNVKQTKLIDNRETKPDQYGNPAKSIHLYTVGGDDQAIASRLFDYLYPTTKTVGPITKQVKANDGSTYPVKLDHAKTVDIYVHIHLKVDNQKFNEDDAKKNITNDVLNYFSTLNMGDSALFSRLFNTGYNQSGVNEVGVAIGKDKNNLSMQDISVNQFELASATPKTINIDWEAV